MPNGNCYYCGEAIEVRPSQDCPKCGVISPLRAREGNKLTRALVVAAVLAVTLGAGYGMFRLMGAVHDVASSPAAAPQDSVREAAFQRTLALVRAVKDAANNPASIEVAEALVTDDGSVGIRYRGTNAFGAMVVNYAILAKDGTVANGPQDKIAALWNKQIAQRTTTDLTREVQGAKLLGAY